MVNHHGGIYSGVQAVNMTPIGNERMEDEKMRVFVLAVPAVMLLGGAGISTAPEFQLTGSVSCTYAELGLPAACCRKMSQIFA